MLCHSNSLSLSQDGTVSGNTQNFTENLTSWSQLLNFNCLKSVKPTEGKKSPSLESNQGHTSQYFGTGKCHWRGLAFLTLICWLSYKPLNKWNNVHELPNLGQRQLNKI